MSDGFGSIHCYNLKGMEEYYPVRITEDLRSSVSGNRLALVNYDERKVFCTPSFDRHKPFFHVFSGADAAAAKASVAAFLDSGFSQEDMSFSLFCREEDLQILYAYANICGDLLAKGQPALREQLPDDPAYSDIYILPLKIVLYPCPVCKHRTLYTRGDFDVCDECGWEDDGTEDEDAYTLVNNDWTIRTYRRKYQLAKQNPDCHWLHSRGNEDWGHRINAIHIRKEDVTALTTCTVSLEQALDNGCHSVNFPLLSYGSNAVSKETWKQAILTCRDFFRKHADADMQITFEVSEEADRIQGMFLLDELAPEYLFDDMPPAYEAPDYLM